MVVNRILKWVAAGVLALGVIPAIGMARSHASLPTDAITVTPTSLQTPAARHSSVKVSRTNIAHVRKTAVRSHKHHVSLRKHHSSATRHHVLRSKTHALHAHKSHSSALSRHVHGHLRHSISHAKHAHSVKSV